MRGIVNFLSYILQLTYSTSIFPLLGNFKITETTNSLPHKFLAAFRGFLFYFPIIHYLIARGTEILYESIRHLSSRVQFYGAPFAL